MAVVFGDENTKKTHLFSLLLHACVCTCSRNAMINQLIVIDCSYWHSLIAFHPQLSLEKFHLWLKNLRHRMIFNNLLIVFLWYFFLCQSLLKIIKLTLVSLLLSLIYFCPLCWLRLDAEFFYLSYLYLQELGNK